MRLPFPLGTPLVRHFLPHRTPTEETIRPPDPTTRARWGEATRPLAAMAPPHLETTPSDGAGQGQVDARARRRPDARGRRRPDACAGHGGGGRAVVGVNLTGQMYLLPQHVCPSGGCTSLNAKFWCAHHCWVPDFGPHVRIMFPADGLPRANRFPPTVVLVVNLAAVSPPLPPKTLFLLLTTSPFPSPSMSPIVVSKLILSLRWYELASPRTRTCRMHSSLQARGHS
jgi:hypothetical protein